MMDSATSNRLINESSPYLLQHAYNPVDWYPWGEEAFAKAKKENKLMIISVGYSACHWCHVMERESFEDVDVAAIMNEFFVSVKVDREERPDIDNIYMEAVQIMTGRGGWPLNCIVLPDGRPVYGGTYFPKANWMGVLQNLQDIYTNDPQKVLEYADHLYKGLINAELVKVSESEEKNGINESGIVQNFVSSFDRVYGGPRKAPKFPMPCNYEFLLAYGILEDHKDILEQVELTLTKMSYGGIFDQIGGGFARYSVDEVWKIPHFEKMLYDNGQLLTLYARAYGYYKNSLFVETIDKTISFLNRELKDVNGVYYSALDADSEGEEGKFYVWKLQELERLLNGKELSFVKEYYSINHYGYWEHDNYVLIRQENEFEVAQKLQIDREELNQLKATVIPKLRAAREKRIRPGTDDKALLAWNATLLKGLAESAMHLNNTDYEKHAVHLYEHIKKCFCDNNNQWFRNYKNGKMSIGAFSEDLALLADALLSVYELTFSEAYLYEVKQLVEILIRDFYVEETGLFYFAHKKSTDLIVQRTEIFDNVIPSPNAVMALVLYKAGMLLGEERWVRMAEKMIEHVAPYFERAPQALGYWLYTWLHMKKQQKEVAVVGQKYKQAIHELRTTYMPAVVWCAGETDHLPMLKSRLISGQTMVYECENKVCNFPFKFNG